MWYYNGNGSGYSIVEKFLLSLYRDSHSVYTIHLTCQSFSDCGIELAVERDGQAFGDMELCHGNNNMLCHTAAVRIRVCFRFWPTCMLQFDLSLITVICRVIKIKRDVVVLMRD